MNTDISFCTSAFSALTLLVLAVRKSIWPVKNMWCGCGCLPGARCRLFACGPADATAIPIISCLIEIQTDFTFLVLTYPGFPGKEAIKHVVVVVVVAFVPRFCAQHHPHFLFDDIFWVNLDQLFFFYCSILSLRQQCQSIEGKGDSDVLSFVTYLCLLFSIHEKYLLLW